MTQYGHDADVPVQTEVDDHTLYTCDVEKDLDLLVSDGSSDSSQPLDVAVRLRAGVSLLPAELPRACSKARLKVSIVLSALRAPAVAPTPWC